MATAAMFGLAERLATAGDPVDIRFWNAVVNRADEMLTERIDELALKIRNHMTEAWNAGNKKGKQGKSSLLGRRKRK